MEVAAAYAGLRHVVGQVFGHAFGQRRHQHAPALLRDAAAFGQKVVHLPLDGADLGHGVHQPGRADHLFGEAAAGPLHLPRTRRGADEDGAGAIGVPFLEFQRAVVHAGGQAEAEFVQHRFPREVAPIHAADLRDRHMAFIDDQQRVLGQVFEQRRRRFAGVPARQVAAVILDALAAARRLQHLDVEGRALVQPLRFQQLALGLQHAQLQLQLRLDVADRLLQRRARRDVVAVGVDVHAVQLARDLTGQGIEFAQRIHLVAEQADAPGPVFQVGWPDIHRLATDAEGTALEGGVVAAVLLFDQPLHQHVAVDPPAAFQLHHHAAVVLDRPDAVDAADGSDDHHIRPFEQRLCRGMAHAVDLLVDLRVLLDIGVGARHIGFGLVVVVVADEVFHRVVGEEALHLAV